MSATDPSNRARGEYPQWPPPDPSTRSTWAPEDWPQRPRRARSRATRTALVAALIGFVAAAAVTIGLVGRHDSGTSAPTTVAPTSVAGAPPTTTPPTPTGPTTTPPTTTPPTTSAPSTTGPTATGGTSPTAAPRDASTSVSLSAGVVVVTTVLGFQQAEAAGTGIVVTSNGEVLTNNHVIDGSTKIDVTVVLTGQTYPATVVGTDPSADVAVLQLSNATGLTAAPIGHSSSVKVGDDVVGIGNAQGRGSLVSAPGSVTATDQTVTAADETGGTTETLQHLIEISARLQPGDSGGPLFDAAGNVVGIDTIGSVGLGRPSVGGRSSGDAFAIPIDTATAAAQLIESGQASATITIGTPPLLGISADPASVTDKGVPITFVDAGTPADTIGLQTGDVIEQVGGDTITSVDDLTAALHAHHAGDQVKITWLDIANGEHSATATLVAGPAN
jgi:S1-C subfamily serine protease